MGKDLLGADYYSKESDTIYWSVSQYKRFRECEARALAELQGNWTDTRDNTALIVGNYVHSYFESQEAHEAFVEENKGDLLAKTGKTKGKLKKDFFVGEEMITSLKEDKNFMALYRGDKEVAITGDINGVTFKGKIDCLNVERGYFVDIKTTKGAIDDTIWTGKERVPWFEAYGYILQMAVYAKLLEDTYGRPFEPIIYAVTKENPPDTRAIRIQNINAMAAEIEELESRIERLDEVKKGRVPAEPCGHCEYCREKKLTPRVMVY